MTKKELKKAIIETTGDFAYLDMNKGQSIHANRPTVVELTNFINEKIAEGNIKILVKDLPEFACDNEFLKTFVEAKGDVDFAVEAYAAECGVDLLGNEIEVEKKNSKKK